MIRNYFKTAWRNLFRNRLVALINIGGLGIGLAVAFIIMAWVVDEMSYNKFHKNLPDIHAVMENIRQGGDVFTTASVPGPLAASLRDEIPEVTYAARVSHSSQQLVSYQDKAISEEGIYAEPDYFRIMTFPAIAGDPLTTLAESNAVVITESTAIKLFGNENPIGKIITLNGQQSVAVGAVIADIPPNSSYNFNVVLPFSLFEKDNSPAISSWNNNFMLTWVQLKPGTDREQLNAKLTALIRDKTDSKTTELFAYPLADLAMHGKFKNGKPAGGRMEMLVMMGALGLFVLVIACANFMNLSTARSERRAKEVGVRKAVGARRKDLVIQFLSEAFLTTFLALIAAVVASKLLLPAWNNLTGKHASLDFSNWKIPAVLLATALITGLISGLYPAFFLSRFRPVKVLKGFVAATRGGAWLRKGLVTFQFIISSFLIVFTMVIYRQVQYGQQLPVGYDQQYLIDIPAKGEMADKFDLFRSILVQQPGIQAVSASSNNMVGINGSSNGFQWPGKAADQDFPIFMTHVHYDWAKTTGVSIVDGRDFSREHGSDTLTCILNQAAVKRMNLKEPVIGTLVDNHKVIGVAADFVYNDVFGSPAPLIVFLGTGKMNHFFVRLDKNADMQQGLSTIEDVFKQVGPGYPFEYRLTEEVYGNKFIGIKSGGQFSSMVGVLAILISCMGLFALSMFIAERRTKEIGIRKVLGASAWRIGLSLSTDFLKPVALAFLITVPLALFVMQKVLSSMEHRITLSWWMFGLAGLMVILLALVIVSFQAVKAAVANPVDSLRDE